MTHVGALSSIVHQPSEGGFPSIRPRWLGPLTTMAAILAHLALGVLFMNFTFEKIVPLDTVGVDLIPEGDQFESVEQVEMDDVPPPEAVEQPDFAIPPPLVMQPDAPPLPSKSEVTEQQKRVVEKRRDVPQAERKQRAQERHRLGIEGGQATSGGLSRASYEALLSAAIRRHVPSSTALGPGSATCGFHVSMGGGMTGVSCSGSSAAHASLLRMAIASVQAPPPPGGGFSAVQTVNFH